MKKKVKKSLVGQTLRFITMSKDEKTKEQKLKVISFSDKKKTHYVLRNKTLKKKTIADRAALDKLFLFKPIQRN